MAKAQLWKTVIRQLLSFRGVALVSLVAVVALVSACISVLLESRHELIRRADMMAGNVLVLADQTVQIEIGRYDTRLLDIITDLHDSGTADGHATPTGDQLFGGAALRNSIGDIIIIGAHGDILTSSRPDLTPQYAAALPGILMRPGTGPNGLAISTIPPNGQRQPLLALTRRCLPGACGPAAGIVAMLPMSWIQGVFDGIDLGPNGAIALVDGTGTLLARKPALPRKIGHSFGRPKIIDEIPRDRPVRYQKRSITDGLHRRVTAGWVGDFPLIVFVGISTSDILRAWTDLAGVTIFAVVVLSGGLIVLTVLLARQLRRKTQVDLQLVSANAQLAELARTDPLTGLLNRRGFDDNLDREWRRCRRAGKPISLLMLDADHFKQYNDRFGHQAGDGVLRALAECVLTRIRRPGDIAARYGGEEFSVVLPDTDSQAALRIAETIRASVESMGIPHGMPGAVVTVSIGMSHALPGAAPVGGAPAGSPDELLAVADAALYESKAMGRNRVTTRPVTLQPAAERART
jgi:diguanylate cyclase (GGDEF)-like protein